MADPGDTAFEQFIVQRKKDLQRIARHTQGECQLSDVQAEAWLMAYRLQQAKEIAVDYPNRGYQDLLLGHLYQHLVRYTEHQVRHAIRLDHWVHGDSPENESHPLLNKLAADEGRDPLATLIEWEAASQQIIEPGCHHSLASAYVHLLRRFDNKMRVVADHLLISVSYCYRRCARARLLAQCQHPLPASLGARDDGFSPGPWRRYKLGRTPAQVAFDFDNDASLWGSLATTRIASRSGGPPEAYLRCTHTR